MKTLPHLMCNVLCQHRKDLECLFKLFCPKLGCSFCLGTSKVAKDMQKTLSHQTKIFSQTLSALLNETFPEWVTVCVCLENEATPCCSVRQVRKIQKHFFISSMIAMQMSNLLNHHNIILTATTNPCESSC